jgi:hypothetical protein
VTFAYITESQFTGIWTGFKVIGPPIAILAGPELVPHNVKLTYIAKG